MARLSLQRVRELDSARKAHRAPAPSPPPVADFGAQLWLIAFEAQTHVRVAFAVVSPRDCRFSLSLCGFCANRLSKPRNFLYLFTLPKCRKPPFSGGFRYWLTAL